MESGARTAAVTFAILGLSRHRRNGRFAYLACVQISLKFARQRLAAVDAQLGPAVQDIGRCLGPLLIGQIDDFGRE